MTKLNRTVFFCDCMMPEHNFIVETDPYDKEIRVSVNLNHYLPFYKRIIPAIRYIFGPKYVLGYDEVLLCEKDRDELVDLLKDFNYNKN